MIRLIVMVSVLGLVACGGDKTSEAPAKPTESTVDDKGKTGLQGDAASQKTVPRGLTRCGDDFRCLQGHDRYRKSNSELQQDAANEVRV